MGRYDKIKVYDGSAWVKPTHLRIYNGSGYTDLGKDDSDNKTPLHVYDANGNLQRVTLNKKVTTVAGETYTDGPWNLLPAGGYCWNYGGANMVISGTIRRTSATDKRIYYSGNGGSVRIELWWLADGRLKLITTNQYGAENVRYSSNYVNVINTWVSFKVYQNYNADYGGIEWNGTYTQTWTNGFEINAANVWNTVGSSGLHFKGTFTCQGRQYNYGTRYFSNNMSTIKGTDNNTYQNVNHVDTSYETVSWE